jgi:hypothetical protein
MDRGAWMKRLKKFAVVLVLLALVSTLATY